MSCLLKRNRTHVKPYLCFMHLNKPIITSTVPWSAWSKKKKKSALCCGACWRDHWSAITSVWFFLCLITARTNTLTVHTACKVKKALWPTVECQPGVKAEQSFWWCANFLQVRRAWWWTISCASRVAGILEKLHQILRRGQWTFSSCWSIILSLVPASSWWENEEPKYLPGHLTTAAVSPESFTNALFTFQIHQSAHQKLTALRIAENTEKLERCATTFVWNDGSESVSWAWSRFDCRPTVRACVSRIWTRKETKSIA